MIGGTVSGDRRETRNGGKERSPFPGCLNERQCPERQCRKRGFLIKIELVMLVRYTYMNRLKKQLELCVSRSGKSRSHEDPDDHGIHRRGQGHLEVT